MPTFTDLPNELITITWSFVDEPSSIESFALVSHKIHSLSGPFLKAHARLQHTLPTILIDIERDPDEPHSILEQLLHHPRLAYYVHEAQIDDFVQFSIHPSISPATLTPSRISLFEDAVLTSPYIPPSKKELWNRTIKTGSLEPIVALILMRLTKLQSLRLLYPYTGGNAYLHATLKRMTQIPHDAANHFAKKSSPFRHIESLELNLSGTSTTVLSALLRSAKDLHSFAFSDSSNMPYDFPALNRTLLRHSKASLRKLTLHSDSDPHHPLDRLIDFPHLVRLKINLNFLLLHDQESPQKRRLVHVLPKSLKKLLLYLENGASPYKIENIVDQVVECKVDRCPRLKTFWIEMIDPVEMDSEEESQLKEKSAEVGVEFNIGEYEYEGF